MSVRPVILYAFFAVIIVIAPPSAIVLLPTAIVLWLFDRVQDPDGNPRKK